MEEEDTRVLFIWIAMQLGKSLDSIASVIPSGENACRVVGTDEGVVAEIRVMVVEVICGHAGAMDQITANDLL